MEDGPCADQKNTQATPDDVHGTSNIRCRDKDNPVRRQCTVAVEQLHDSRWRLNVVRRRIDDWEN